MTAKLEKLRDAFRSWKLDGVVLLRRDNIAWLTDGVDVHVVERSELGIAALLVTSSAVFLLTQDNELPRLLEEETWPFPIEARSCPWSTPLIQQLAALIAPDRLGADVAGVAAEAVDQRLVTLRAGLEENERRRLTALGEEAAAVVEEVGQQVAAGWSELQVEALIAQRCLERGIRPVCTLVAADDRITRYKHPVPGRREVDTALLMTLGAERHGLNVSLTRMVHFGPLPESRRRALEKVSHVHAAALEASEPGRSWESIFSAIQQAYAEVGEPEGWQGHHQGGSAGYGCRDVIVTPGTAGAAVPFQAFSWNPTLPGVKSEDTAVHDDDGLRWVTRTMNWPTISVTRGTRTVDLAGWLIRT